MAYMNSYRGAQSPRDDAAYQTQPSNALSPNRNPNRLSAGSMGATQDARAGLHRRFTTNALPTLSPIGQQRRQAAGDYPSAAAYSRLPPSERAADKYERLLIEQRRLQDQIDRIDPEARREVDEGRRHELAVTQMMAQSEPTTPPEYDGFPSSMSRPNRYSSTSLTSPPGIVNRPNRASTHLTSPPGMYRGFATGNNNLPSQSVPGSRRQSDDEDDDEEFLYSFDIHRAAANPNRNSMPVTGYDRKRSILPDLSSALGPVNTTSFLFGEDGKPSKRNSQNVTTSPPNGKTFLHLQQTADGFPKLIRREDNGELSLSASSAALDLALSQTPEPEKQVTERSVSGRHRVSLPPSAYSNTSGIAGLNSILANANDSKPSASNRRSMEVKFAVETKRPGLVTSPPRANGVPKAMSSYSTNDIPTLKSINGEQSGGVPVTSPPLPTNALSNTTSPLQNNSNLSRISSASANINRRSQEVGSATTEESASLLGAQSGLQANAAPFGPGSTGVETGQLQAFSSPAMSPYAQPAFYGGYGMQMLGAGISNLNLTGGYGSQGQGQSQVQGQPQGQWPNQITAFQQGAGYAGLGQFPPSGQAAPGANRYSDSQRNVVQQRRQQTDEANARFSTIKIQDLKGEIYNLCKDQHGCRFLQRKLEERDEETVEIIYTEVKANIIELMTDPFGNYLCQKLLESASDEQRTGLIHNAMPAMTKISLNQHGTRALQKMIEFITTPEQTQMIIEALRFDVVQLIQDLNGNHVIQKCLNHLTAQDAQFIFDAVGTNCVTVGTHRHGCCVLQRCIDHASGHQKGELISQITNNAFALVQDPFGNYVVQYILDLAEPAFTQPLCASFIGSVAFLSKQKFSSNVIEKCLRCAETDTKRALIQEIVPQHELEKLLRDSFANYVVQTAIDFADEETKAMMVASVRPILPAIRNTPYGRRIQSKISEYDAARTGSGLSSGAMTPIDSNTSAGAPMQYNGQSAPSGRGNRMGFIAPHNWSGPAAFNNAGGPPSVNNIPAGYTNPTWTGQNGGPNNGVAAPSPQRNNQAYSMLNGNNQAYQGGGWNGFSNVNNDMGTSAYNGF